MDKLNIVRLNLDVLDLIYSELDELEDQLSLAAVHPNLSEAFAYHNRRTFKKISFHDENSELKKQVHLILQHCGRNVKALHDYHDYGSETSVKMLQLAQQFCPNLEYLTVFITPDNIKQIERNLIKLKTLKGVKIIRHNNPNIDNLLKCILRFKNIKKMELKVKVTAYIFKQ